MLKLSLPSIYIFVALFVCYYIFSGINEPFFLIAGVISSLLGVYVAIKLNFVDDYPRVGLKFLKYFAWLFKEIIISTIVVLRMIWSNAATSEAHFAEVKTTQKKGSNPALGFTILGNSITLTPGTVCVRVDDDSSKIIVHALTKSGMDALHEGNMDKRVLEALK